jgi:O-antigen/teichoic acid export membrane protein
MTGQSRAGAPGLTAEAATVARGSVINLAAMVSGAALGFALTVIVSRWLQPSGAGVFFELVALFTILSNTLELGADTGLTRWISRARAIGGLSEVRRVAAIALVPVLVIGTAAAAVSWVAAPGLAHVFLHGMPTAAGAADVRMIAPLVPLGALSACVLSGARGFGRMWPYLVVEGLGKPAARAVLIVAALLLGWGLHGVIAAWGLPVAAGLVAGWFIFARIMRGETPERTAVPPATARHASRRRRARASRRAASAPGTARRRQLWREFWGFAAPRALQATFQVVVLWLDVLLVGALVSRYAAGIYGAVSKLALVGTFALEGNRLAIAPQLSALLARQHRDRAADLYQSSTRWLMLASWPLYIVFAVFPGVVLGIFGARYTAGATALAVLSLAMLVNLGTGNVTVVLLMGGKSSWSAVNAAVAFAANVSLNLVLLPRIGIAGAAIAWAASIVIDNVAAVIEVRWVLKLAPFGAGYGLAAAATVCCIGVPGAVARFLWGESLLVMAMSVGAGLALYIAVLYLAREPLQLAGMLTALRRRIELNRPGQASQHVA